MTMAPGLGDPHLLRSLTTCLKRRLPPSEVEDVAQTVLCDALASDAPPLDPEELRKWVAGIARHKVADYHRRARRLVLDRDGSCASDAADDEALQADERRRVEARGLLANVAAVPRNERERETLQWLVREHAGEHLSEIADEAGLSGAVVRQRVSRFRRVLRARLGAALALVLALGAGGALYASRPHDTRDTIVAEPAPNASRAALAARGSWRVTSVEVSGPLSEIEKSLLHAELANAYVEVATDRVEILTTSGSV
jgi:DNA-directed RNA polymerase specialized sigma24 family protein